MYNVVETNKPKNGYRVEDPKCLREIPNVVELIMVLVNLGPKLRHRMASVQCKR